MSGVTRRFARLARAKMRVIRINKGPSRGEETVTDNDVFLSGRAISLVRGRRVGGKGILAATRVTKVRTIGGASSVVPLYRPLTLANVRLSFRIGRSRVVTAYTIGALNGANIRVRTVANMDITLLAM